MLTKNLREKAGRRSHFTPPHELFSRSLKRCAITAGCCVFSLNVLAQSNQRITLNLKNASLEQVIWQIQKKTGFVFMYGTTDIQAVKNLTLNEKDKTVNEILDRCLQGTNLTYEISGKEIIIKQADNDKKRTVKGVVVDKDGFPLPGASVRLKGTSTVAGTNVNGEFQIAVSGSNPVLVFSFIGTTTQEVAVTSNKDLKITLTEDVHALDDVVVTGIFKKAKESYTGAVSTITSEQLDMYKGQNLLQTLKNIDASINFAIDNVAGSNPNNLPQLNIRGNSSLPMSVEEFNQTASNTINQPLIIMDGFEITLEKLMDYNDEEIESINILKDAAATAIYGSRGSNGVIVVVTKQPEAGKLRVNAEAGIDIEAPDLTSYDLLKAKEKLYLENYLGLYSSEVPGSDITYQSVYNQRLRSVLSGQSTDWISKPIHTGIGSHYNLRLEGGSEQFRWSATTSYKDTEGAMKNSSRRTFNASITLMYTIKNLTFKNYTSYGVTRSQESNYGLFSDYVAQQPYNSPYDENGEIVQFFDAFYGSESGGEFNPLYDASLKSFTKSGYEELTNNFSLEWKIIDGLTFRGQFGITTNNNHNDTFLSPKDSYFTVDPVTSPDYSTDEGFLRRGSYTYGTGNSLNYSGNITLSYNKVFQEKHSLYAGLDYFINESNSEKYYFNLEGFSSENMTSIGNARQYAENGIPSESSAKKRMFGLTANVNYTYDSRYYIDLSCRVDGSSTFGTKKKYAPFWSAGIGWNLHNEQFLAGNQVLNILRLKTSYGSTGSQEGSGSGAATLYKYQNNNKYLNWVGAVLTEWGNPRLTWQTTKEFNVGTEFGLWQGRIKGEFNFYAKTTSNLMSYMNIPLSMGFSSYMANVGEVKNRGWEASLSAYIIRDQKKEFNWIINGQLVYNKNWISKLSEAIRSQNEIMLTNDDYDVANLFYEGRPQNSIYAVRSLGIDPSTGKEIYLDKDGNITDVWKAGDKVFLGSSEPLYRGIFGTMLMWKGFTLNVSFGCYWGGKTYNQTLLDRVEVPINNLRSSNADRRVLTNRWLKPGDNTFFKGFTNETTRATSRFVMDDNVLELQSVSLQYRWDNDWIRNKTGVQSITLGMNISDLFHWGSIKMERGTGYPYARNIQGNIKFLF
ncbi:SusC/RagA family TonB-linked outer membrane protein [Phocaeicola coprophilus]|nr:SusC/RagA family TonB-linked outer membrane protein [Phocaeicola coprophilus]